jgi:ribonuclease HI
LITGISGIVYIAAKKRLEPEGVGPPMGSPPWIQPP